MPYSGHISFTNHAGGNFIIGPVGTSLLNASNDSVVGTLVVPHGHSYVVNVYAVDSFGRLSCAVSSNAMVEDKAGMCVHICTCACKILLGSSVARF